MQVDTFFRKKEEVVMTEAIIISKVDGDNLFGTVRFAEKDFGFTLNLETGEYKFKGKELPHATRIMAMKQILPNKKVVRKY